MKQQKIVFAQKVKKQIVHYHESTKTESRTDSASVKLTATQKAALTAICNEAGIGVSTFIAQALDAWIELYPFQYKLVKHRDMLLALLKSLS